MISLFTNLFKSKTKPIENTFLWKYIELDNNLVEELKDIYLKAMPTNLSCLNFFNVLPINVPNINGVKVTCCSLIYKAGNESQKYAHKDPLLHSSLALNIPLINCEDSVTTLYDDSKHSLHVGHRDNLIQILPVKDGKVLSTYILDKPVLFNTRIFHNVENFSSEPRIAISLRFDRNPVEWLQDTK